MEKTIGERLKQLRLRRLMTQAEVAEEFDIC
jgi:transcriptional regulator with XRE-family HTH domain